MLRVDVGILMLREVSTVDVGLDLNRKRQVDGGPGNEFLGRQ